MRGILKSIKSLSLSEGITPAHAGNTQILSSSGPASRDHPRACGEYIPLYLSLCRILGSPPRMRGIPSTLGNSSSLSGITPAHAGNTSLAVR